MADPISTKSREETRWKRELPYDWRSREEPEASWITTALLSLVIAAVAYLGLVLYFTLTPR